LDFIDEDSAEPRALEIIEIGCFVEFGLRSFVD
jgi:hypothetical protein